MELTVLSLKDIAAAKVAVEICNSCSLKKEIFVGPESDIAKNKEDDDDEYSWEAQWKRILQMKAGVAVKDLALPLMLQEKLTGLILLIGMRMANWKLYHDTILKLNPEYCINFVNSTFFTSRGIFDKGKAAEMLIKDKSLSVEQRYLVACLYCFTDDIPDLYNQLNEDALESIEDSRGKLLMPGIIKFWSYYLRGEVDKLRGSKSLELYRLEKAVESGSVAAVQYCLEEMEENHIIYAAVHALKNVLKSSESIGFSVLSNEQWIPKSFYMDILCFIFRKMRDDQKIELLKKDLQSDYCLRTCTEDQRYSTILDHFLNWPYRDLFMKTAMLTWRILPESNFAILLENISDIIHGNDEALKSAQEKSYDYRWLLKEFWNRSPKRFKKYVLSNVQITLEIRTIRTIKAATHLLANLVTLKPFTKEDGDIIQLIFSNAKRQEKEHIMFSKEWRNFCISLIVKEDWVTLDTFMAYYLTSEEEKNIFKRFICEGGAWRIFFSFVNDDKLNAVEYFFKWCHLSEEEISAFKEGMLYSDSGKNTCQRLFLFGFETLMDFIAFGLPSEEKGKLFIKELFLDSSFKKLLLPNCAKDVIYGESEEVEKFLHFCQFSEEEIRQLKESMADKMGSKYCKSLLSANSYRWCHTLGRRIEFNGGQWEKVEKLLTWCFLSEEEISEYKKGKLLEESGKEIHYNLIKSNQWEEAETFFAWLGLSAEETKKLKKETLFYLNEAGEMYRNMGGEETGDDNVAFGSEQELREPFLRWYLTDKEAVLEFKENFRKCYIDSDGNEKAGLQEFDLLTEKLLKDFDEEQIELK